MSSMGTIFCGAGDTCNIATDPCALQPCGPGRDCRAMTDAEIAEAERVRSAVAELGYVCSCAENEVNIEGTCVGE